MPSMKEQGKSESTSSSPCVDVNSNVSREKDETTVLKEKRIIQPSSQYVYIASGDFDIVWTNVIVFVVFNLLTLYSYHRIFLRMHLYKVPMVISALIGTYAGLGITAGAHRLWSHRSYKAKLPLRIFLMVGQTVAGQNCLYTWCRDHRVHHKYSETNADPHNTKRGFFFAHIGWLLRKKHPHVKIQSEKLDFSDLLADPVVRFQKRHYNVLYLAFAVLLPIGILYSCCELCPFDCLLLYIARYVISLHITWFINSTAHMFGPQPYSKQQEGRENSLISFGALGEGYHNYHHTFPYDYKTAETGMTFNVTKLFIDLMAYTGQAYDLKSVSLQAVEKCKISSKTNHS